MVLILSTPRDDHAQAVLAELLRLGARAHLLDLAEFPQRLGLFVQFEEGSRSMRFGCEKESLDLRSCGAAWWRRPQQPEVSQDLARTSHRNFAMNECVEALQGLWQSMDAFWMNDPVRDQAAHRKVYQLRVAQETGLTIPDTLVTNCSCAVQDFAGLRGHDRVIYKSFSATEQEWRETRLLKEEELKLLDNVRYAPVIFQEYIEADVDLRVTVVGEQIFAAAIHSQETAYKVDFRMDWAHAPVEAAQLPGEIEELLRKYMRRLGLVYGAIDMRRTPEGRHVFLEVNPAGQWLFVEQRTGLKITEAVAGLLDEKDRHRSSAMS